MSALSGQKVVTTAGTAVALGSLQVSAPIMVKALDTNTDYVYIGNDGAGDVSSANGLQLAADEAIVFQFVGNLGSIMLNSVVNGEGVSWLVLDA
jgi:hypothetical protein